MYGAMVRAGACAVALALVAAGPVPAAAQKKERQRNEITGTFDVKFEEIANNCKDTGMRLRTCTFELTQKKRGLEVSFPLAPVMSGSVSRNGRFRADAAKGATATQGVAGKFSVAGRVAGDVIQLVFIAEYFRGKAPLCTQSWNASGIRQKKT